MLYSLIFAFAVVIVSIMVLSIIASKIWIWISVSSVFMITSICLIVHDIKNNALQQLNDRILFFKNRKPPLNFSQGKFPVIRAKGQQVFVLLHHCDKFLVLRRPNC